MKILMADDEPMALEELREAVLTVKPTAEVFCANNYQQILEQAKKENYDIAMLDIRMPGMTGLELAKNLKYIQPKIDIIFVTAYSEYALEAFSMYASGYLLKPVSEKAVKEALENLRHLKTPAVSSQDHKLYIQCFGKFEVFYQGNPLVFPREKAKEILAYLIDLKGGSANTDELCIVLWEDNVSEKKKHYLRTLLRDLKNVLKDCHASDVLQTNRNSFCVDTSKIDCDYYRFLRQEPEAVMQYHREYMKQYSWAEVTLGILENRK